ncbi:MAG: hypothetical protein EA417_11895 [Gammaproteobacteria bacterium]|nr:MAG: hypothetical protein EA417_11895 [Gammaproteobacteria bacterium]
MTPRLLHEHSHQAQLDDALLPAWESGDLRDPDRFMAAGVTLKDDASSWVVRTCIGDERVVIKRERHPDPWRRWRRMLRRSRAQRAWSAAHWLQAAGIACAAPLGWIERRHGPLYAASWLISRHVPGVDAASALAARQAEPECLMQLLDALADVLLRLQRCGFVHGDLKASNVLVGKDGLPVLIDLHAVHRPLSWRRAQAFERDRARLLRNWSAEPETVRALQTRLEQAERSGPVACAKRGGSAAAHDPAAGS